MSAEQPAGVGGTLRPDGEPRPVAQRVHELMDAVKVLAEFAKTAPGRLPSRVQEAITLADGVLVDAALPTDEWDRAQRICDLPEVDEAIRCLLEDNTGDNATCVVRAVLRASGVGVPAAPRPCPGIDTRAEAWDAWRKEWDRTHNYKPMDGDAFDAGYRAAWKAAHGVQVLGEGQPE